MSSGVEVRPAVVGDCLEIRRLIQELADYEKMPDGPKIGHKTLEVDGFGGQPHYHCVVSYDKSDPDHLVGYLLYFYVLLWKGKAVYMEDIYVTPSHRAKGVGNAMWKAVLKTGRAEGAIEGAFVVLCWNTPSMDFFKRRGAINTSETIGYHLFRMTASTMNTFAAKMAQQEDIRIRSASPADCVTVHELQKELAAWMNIQEHLHLTPEDIASSISASPPVCYIIVAETEGQIVGFVIYYFTYSTWVGRSLYIEDIYVKDQYRKKNIGTLLWQTVVQRGLSLGCSRCEFVVVKDNSSAIAYYERKGAVNITKTEGWNTLLLPQQSMEKMAEM